MKTLADEIKRLREFSEELLTIREYHACITGDCPHTNVQHCFDALKKYHGDSIGSLISSYRKLTSALEVARVALEEIDNRRQRIYNQPLEPSRYAEDVANEALAEMSKLLGCGE